MRSGSWQYAQQIGACPPKVDRCDLGGDDDGYWHCSADLRGGIFKCPQALESLTFCPDGRACTQPQQPVRFDEDPVEHMCYG